MFAETVTAIAADLRARRYSSLDITEHYLARIARVDPELNSYITVCPESARAAAARADALLAQGAIEDYAYITHGVLSGGAVARITGSKLKELVITDSIQPTQAVRVAHNIRVLSVATLIGEAIGRTAAEESVSSLFDD